MEDVLTKYSTKLARAGLTAAETPLMGTLDDEIVWNRPDPRCEILARVLTELHMQAILFAPPAEPYQSIIADLCARSDGAISPKDSETRTFLHDLPVAREFTADAIIAALRHRKGVIIPGEGIVTYGTVSPEQAFITYSSTCFACFVKFFSDLLTDHRQGVVDPLQLAVMKHIRADLYPAMHSPHPIRTPVKGGPFSTAEEVLEAMEETGRLTVESGFVDSYFGNISCLHGKTLFISQTGSSLDELATCIDPVPLDGSSCAGMTASSELSAHKEIVLSTEMRTVLHGHPRFSVIMSMVCEEKGCECEGLCHIKCPRARSIGAIPIVPGEVGTGPYGLYRTVPSALKNAPGVIVYGHGVFTTGRIDFKDAYEHLVNIETLCREAFFQMIAS